MGRRGVSRGRGRGRHGAGRQSARWDGACGDRDSVRVLECWEVSGQSWSHPFTCAAPREVEASDGRSVTSSLTSEGSTDASDLAPRAELDREAAGCGRLCPGRGQRHREGLGGLLSVPGVVKEGRQG